MAPIITRRTRLSAALGAFALVAGLATTIATTQSAQAAPAKGTATYLVQLTDAPVAGYTGGVAGYAGTKPTAGTKIDTADPAVARYRGYLAQRQDGVLRAAASARTIHRYSVTFNGFAATMTAADAAKLARTAGVKAVVKDEKLKVDTTRTPEFLGLTKPGGIWDQLGGPSQGRRCRRRRRRPRHGPVAGEPVGRAAAQPQAGEAVLRHLRDRRAVGLPPTAAPR